MKPNRPPLFSLLIALLLSFAAAQAVQYAPAPSPAPKPAAPPSSSKDTAPAPKIEGIPLARNDGRWLGLAVEGGNFKLRFYDKDKKPVKPDAARAAVRWSPQGKIGEQHTVLNPAGNTLTSPLLVPPPLTFRVYLTLLGADDQAIETFVTDLHDL